MRALDLCSVLYCVARCLDGFPNYLRFDLHFPLQSGKHRVWLNVRSLRDALVLWNGHAGSDHAVTEHFQEFITRHHGHALRLLHPHRCRINDYPRPHHQQGCQRLGVVLILVPHVPIQRGSCQTS